MTPEMPRMVPVDRIGATGLDYTVTATPADCVAMAARLMVPAVAELSCEFRLKPTKAGAIVAEGRLRARLTQVCVVSLDEFTVRIDERFRVRFVPEGREDPELDPDSDDEIPYSGVAIDLGEAAAEQLALMLDPYPRKPGADLPAAADDSLTSPFAALARLKRPS
jgi:uncharacterized metal-binding protein YceD (DUF177 family)